MRQENVYIHATAEVSPEAAIGAGTQIWHQAQVRERARIGRNCILGKGVYVDFDVVIGDNCKLQNGVWVYHPARVEDGVFLGPGVIVTNERYPCCHRTGTSRPFAHVYRTATVQCQLS